MGSLTYSVQIDYGPEVLLQCEDNVRPNSGESVGVWRGGCYNLRKLVQEELLELPIGCYRRVLVSIDLLRQSFDTSIAPESCTTEGTRIEKFGLDGFARGLVCKLARFVP